MRTCFRRLTLTGLCAVAFVASACSMTKMAANSTVDIMVAGAPALAEEPDPDLAEAAIKGNLGMMSGLMKVVPDNPSLYRLAAEAYSSMVSWGRSGWLVGPDGCSGSVMSMPDTSMMSSSCGRPDELRPGGR